eukprot:TRINITY_DN73341_c0_g1_i1.p1 TRINITY_DN73341_c0_g1~~TRINITY_DN73341_c0_g1_i1.p1  ORF type:complete len:432 (+),score=58.39 TRINITY_DN73341_c0_g1_i1:50-1345(+)
MKHLLNAFTSRRMAIVLLSVFAISPRLASALHRCTSLEKFDRGGKNTFLLDEVVQLLTVHTSTAGRKSAKHVAEPVQLSANSSLRVAFAIFMTDVRSVAFEDAVAVLVHSIRSAAQRSRHKIDVMALVPTRFSAEAQKSLSRAGVDRVLRYPLLVPTSLIKNRRMQYEQSRRSADGSFLFAEEQIKYWGLHLTSYDRVLVLDADMLVLDPMDELMNLPDDFVGIYDTGLDIEETTAPAVQGGFLLFRPNLTDLESIRQLTIEGDFTSFGWKGSGVGFCYGGTGPDGLLSYYFQRDALFQMRAVGKARLPERVSDAPLAGSRMRAVDRSVYDFLLNEQLMSEVEQDNRSREEVLRDVKSVHFTGQCPKPWACYEPRDWLCAGLYERWWEVRADLERTRGLPPSPRACHGGYWGTYAPLGSSVDDLGSGAKAK